jgi:hypothetical protein
MTTNMENKQSHKQAFELAMWMKEHQDTITARRWTKAETARRACGDLHRGISGSMITAASSIVGFEWPNVSLAKTGKNKVQENRVVARRRAVVLKELVSQFTMLCHDLERPLPPLLNQCVADPEFLGYFPSDELEVQ